MLYGIYIQYICYGTKASKVFRLNRHHAKDMTNTLLLRDKKQIHIRESNF